MGNVTGIVVNPIHLGYIVNPIDLLGDLVGVMSNVVHVKITTTNIIGNMVRLGYGQCLSKVASMKINAQCGRPVYKG